MDERVDFQRGSYTLLEATLIMTFAGIVLIAAIKLTSVSVENKFSADSDFLDKATFVEDNTALDNLLVN